MRLSPRLNINRHHVSATKRKVLSTPAKHHSITPNRIVHRQNYIKHPQTPEPTREPPTTPSKHHPPKNSGEPKTEHRHIRRPCEPSPWSFLRRILKPRPPPLKPSEGSSPLATHPRQRPSGPRTVGCRGPLSFAFCAFSDFAEAFFAFWVGDD